MSIDSTYCNINPIYLVLFGLNISYKINNKKQWYPHCALSILLTVLYHHERINKASLSQENFKN